MSRYARVLAAVDGSAPAHRAFHYALALSAKHGAEIVVVQAVPPDHAFRWQAAERAALMDTLGQRAREAGVAFTHRVQQGDPADVVLLHARALGADVIVAGTHQRRGLARLRAGSVGERIAARATVPVLLVPGRLRAVEARPPGHVAVAVDVSAAAQGVVDAALALARDHGDRMTLVHVVPGFPAGTPPHLYRYGIAEYQQTLVREARRRLHQLVPEHERALVVEARVLQGDAVAEITAAVDALGADLLVVGTTTRGVVTRAVFGTTATRLIRAAGVPVLTVPGSPAAGARLSDARRAA